MSNREAERRAGGGVWAEVWARGLPGLVYEERWGRVLCEAGLDWWGRVLVLEI